MDVTAATELAQEALVLSLKLGAPLLIVAIAVGFLSSILQAITQIQDQTLSFVPKLLAMLLTMLYTLPWALTELADYATALIEGIPSTL